MARHNSTFNVSLKKVLHPSSLINLFFVVLIIVFFTAITYSIFNGYSVVDNPIVMECLDLILTVFLVDRLYKRQSMIDDKARLIRQVGSRDNSQSISALAELNAHGWLMELGLFENAWLRGANLSGAVVWGVDFSGTQLERADFSHADLVNSRFIQTDLRLVNFSGAKAIGAKFKADLINSSFRDSYLQEATFDECWLLNTDFSNANLQGAKFNNCDMSGAIFTNAIYNNQTKFPESINIKELGAVFVEDLIPLLDHDYSNQ